MSRIEPRRVTEVEPLHAGTEIRLRCLHNGMIMCRHQRERVDPEAIAHMHFPQQLQEVRAVAVVPEYLASLRTPMEYMIPPIENLDSKRSCHTGIFNRESSHCQQNLGAIDDAYAL